MTDYHPIIARCVAELQDSAAVRQEFYWLARAELEVQLSGLNPPMTESEVICERGALDEAIRKVEAERRPSIDTQSLKAGPQQPEALPSRKGTLECSEICLNPDLRPFAQRRQQPSEALAPEYSKASIVPKLIGFVGVILVGALAFTLYLQGDQFIAPLFRSTVTQARQTVKSSPVLTYYVGQIGDLISTPDRRLRK